MKIIAFLAATFVAYRVLGCEPAAPDLSRIERDCAALVATVKVPVKGEVVLSLSSLPTSIAELDPLRVRVNEEGLYIELKDPEPGSVGYFYLSEGSVVSDSWANSQGFIRATERMYLLPMPTP